MQKHMNNSLKRFHLLLAYNLKIILGGLHYHKIIQKILQVYTESFRKQTLNSQEYKYTYIFQCSEKCCQK